MLLFLVACGPERFPCGEGTEEVDGECVVDYPDPPECPQDVESFCEEYFGRACPSREEAITWTCDGYMFDPTGAADTPVDVSNREDSCEGGIYCFGDGSTGLHFSGDDLEWILVSWPEDEECGGRRDIDNLWC